MIIREARAADRAQWDDLWAGYLNFYESTLAPDVTDTTWRRLLDPNEPMQALVAEDERGALIGFTHVVFHRGTWSVGDFCYLEDLFVAPTARKQGAARAQVAGRLERVRVLVDQAEVLVGDLSVDRIST